ncbi:Diguanylate cyclase DosC [Altererythrobacter insulae]|nr:Diguanylate cyclase DosC [Altererythrobacter insulae]
MDVQVLTLIIPLTTLIFSGILLAVWWQDRGKVYILGYAAWFLGISLGITMQAWLISDFGPPEVVFFHLLSTAGLIALLWAIAKHDHRRLPLSALLGVTLATAVVLWFARASDVQSVVIMAQNFNAGLLFAMGAYGKWQSPQRHFPDRLILFMLTLLAAYSIFRPSITVLLQDQMTMEQYQESIFLTLNLAMTSLLSMLLACALFASIFADRLHEEKTRTTQDALSGLLMRAIFEKRARAAIKKANEDEVPVSLIITDIDHFKAINDTHGHSVGDTAIARFGEIIRSNIRSKDMAGRVGGEEFCILAWNCPLGPASNLAERIRVAVSQRQRSDDDDTVQYTASFGVAELRREESYQSLFERADEYLYEAKRSGRDRVHTRSGAVDLPSAQVVEMAAVLDRRQTV